MVNISEPEDVDHSGGSSDFAEASSSGSSVNSKEKQCDRIRVCLEERQRKAEVVDNSMAQSSKLEELVRDAEKSKILIHRPQGKEDFSQLTKFYEINDVYCKIGSHMKHSLRRKIERGEYVNLAKLPKNPKFDDDDDDDDNCQLVNRDGRAMFIPVNDKQRRMISNVEKWEEA